MKDSRNPADFLNAENIDILKASRLFDLDDIRPPFFQCRSRILMVTDGSLSFSDSKSAQFGLGTFVKIVLGMNSPLQAQVTLAHIGSRNMLPGDSRIHRRITEFRFDNSDHFEPDMYDTVFMFGFSTSYSGRGPSPTGTTLNNTELTKLTTYMNGGGGLFATGDHGALGRAMNSAVPRVARMRLWDNTSSDNDDDEVSMTGERRNDTNRRGDPGSQFNDQSDDIPQTVHPRIYHKNSPIFKYSFPHPLLCGPNGAIRVMPDHPHEGECVEPADTNDTIDFGSPLGPEFPPATAAGARPLPQVISTNTVPGGNVAESGGSFKDPTIPHSFGGICGYDGHLAGVGRVVTDATWLHFVNVNLIGTPTVSAGIKSDGFLSTPQGQVHFEEIKTYYRNLVVWLTRPAIIRCINRGWVFEIVRNSRVIEAVVSVSNVRLEQVSVRTLLFIGQHARDVVGKFAGQCQSRRLQQWLVDLLPKAPEFEVLKREFDPWAPQPLPEEEERPDRNLGMVELSPIFDIALGAALVEANQYFDEAGEKLDQKKFEKVLASGFHEGADRAISALRESFYTVEQALVGKK